MEKLFPLTLVLATVLLSVNGLPSEERPTADPTRTNLLNEIRHNFTANHGLQLSQSNSDFAWRFFSQINAEATSKNNFFSPISISAALSLVSLGTHSNTQQQLCTALGYTNASIPQSSVHEAFKLLLQVLAGESGSTLSMGSSLFVQDGFSLEKKFVDDATNYYQAATFNVDFRDTENAKQQINTYVRNNTKGKIEELFKSISQETLLVVVNYIFFKGTWLKPFNPQFTREDDFHVDDSTTVKVQMMGRNGRYYVGYERDLATLTVLLPYKGNVSLVLLLPDPGKIQVLEKNFTISKFLPVLQNSQMRFIDLRIPKFSLKTSYQLKAPMMKLGVTDLFDSQADLSGISKSPNLKVSQIVHEAVLEIDEVGTTAVAATGVEIMPMMLPQRVKFNRPFFLMIVEHTTKTALFTGKVVNPAGSM